MGLFFWMFESLNAITPS